MIHGTFFIASFRVCLNHSASNVHKGGRKEKKNLDIYVFPSIIKLCIFAAGVQYNAEKEDKSAWENKQKEIQRIEDAKKAEAEKRMFTNQYLMYC
jgi:hypothetical protein